MTRRQSKPSADVFAVADQVPNTSDLTAGKLYKLSAGEIFAADEFGRDPGFVIFDDVGDELYCLWKECARLGHADWRRVSASGEAL